MPVVNTMVVSFNSSTGLISVVPTLPPLSETPGFMLFMYRDTYGVGDYHPQIMSLAGTLPQTRGQLPFRRTQFFIRVVGDLGTVYDCPPVEMDYSSSTLIAGNVKYTELHVPERAELGDTCRCHAFSYDLKNGAGVSGTIVDVIRAPLVPDAVLTGPYQLTGKTFTAPAPFFNGDEGTRTHSYALGYY